MRSPHFDPETARLAALTALRALSRQRDQMPERRAALLASAWHAGERNIRELARIADVSRQTVYDDLRAQAIDPGSDRGAVTAAPRSEPLAYDKVSDLADQMAAVLTPMMRSVEVEPLADAAWMAHKAIYAIAEILNPDPLPAEQGAGSHRAAWLDTLVYCADRIRQAAHRQWTSEATEADLARFTEQHAMSEAEVGTALLVEQATLTVLLPDGSTRVHLELSSAGVHDPEPDGWTTWFSDSSLPLAPIDGVRHLEISRLLTSLSEVVTGAIHPELIEER